MTGQTLRVAAGGSMKSLGWTVRIENTGSEPLHFLVILSHEEPLTIELSETLAGIPNEVLAKVLGMSESALGELPTEAVTIGAV